MFQKLIDDNDVDVRKVLDCLMVALKWVFLSFFSFIDEFLHRAPEVIEQGFDIPTFNTHTSSVNPKIGEALHDHDHSICWVIFHSQIGKFPWTLPLY